MNTTTHKRQQDTTDRHQNAGYVEAKPHTPKTKRHRPDGGGRQIGDDALLRYHAHPLSKGAGAMQADHTTNLPGQGLC